MAKTIQTAIEAGSRMAPAKFYIKITPDGPYLLYGNPPMDQEIIVLNDEGSSWTYRKGNHFSTTEEPTALCRCGASKNKPYCDGSHHHTDWDPKETASHKPLLEDVEKYIGPTMVLADNEEYCAFARFCDAYGRIWNLVQTAESQEERDLVIHEARLVREDIAGIRVIKALSKTDTERSKFAKINEEVVTRDQHAGMIMGAMNPVMSIILNIGLVLVLFVGAKRVNEGLTTPGVIMAFMSYVTIILNSILFLSRIFVMYSKASASARRISEVLNLPEDLMVEHPVGNVDSVVEKAVNEAEAAAAKETGAEFVLPQIIFDHVSFRYEDGDGEDCLHDVSFTVNKGETLGIIGATGSGKTTIVNLLMRYYDPDEGHIYVNGRDVRTYTSKELMPLFGAAFQNDVIFHDTIYENIRFGRDVSKKEAIAAAHDAQAVEFIEEKGLDTMLAIRGMDLSGGQKQRLLITRALVKHPQILVLDDSSSALDYATDARLRRAIQENYGDLTSIIVAQRISSIYRADKIIVLEDGEMIGYGTHKNLMESCEVYREISQSQMGGGIDEA